MLKHFLYPQVICNIGGETKISCIGNQWENISTVKRIQLKLQRAEGIPAKYLKECGLKLPGKASWALKKSSRHGWRTFQEG